MEYGESYGEGDVITLELTLSPDDEASPEESRLRFLKNGVLQGTAFRGPPMRRTGSGDGLRPMNLVPGVCLGSATGNKLARVSVGHAEVREFDKLQAHHRIRFTEENTQVSNEGKWATCLAAHPGLRSGRFTWSVCLDDTKHGAGVAVGVVDAGAFLVDRQNLGASAQSWCYSKTGKKGDGSGFHNYGKAYTNGDTVTLTLDMEGEKRTLSFAVNGDDQGVAYTEKDGIGECALVPAVCLGSSEGSKLAKVSIVGARPLLRRFDRYACSTKLALKDLYQSVETNDKWGTVLLEHAGIRSPARYSFGITIVSANASCGAGVGFAEAGFDPERRNLGAYESSYCFSKTGKFSDGKDFRTYGSAFKTGDVVTAEVDMEQEIMRFFINGKHQGERKVEGIRNKTLVPAVVLGSNAGGHYTRLSIGLPAVSRFDKKRQHKSMEVREDDKTAFSSARWCSILADHPGVSRGEKLRFAVKLSGDGGAAIGFAEANTFRPYAQNLGASAGTWAISKTGKVSQGDEEAFRPFSEKFGAEDVIGAEADLVEGTIRFWKNGSLLGTAFHNLLQPSEVAGGEAAGGAKRQPLNLVPAVCLGSNAGGKNSSATIVEFLESWLG